jgi:membrane associated rhomboid family serine protease
MIIQMGKIIRNLLIFILVLWGVRIVDSLLPTDLCQFGIVPRNLVGLLGLIFAPFLHGNYFHLISNTVPVFVLLLILFFFYPKNAWTVIIESVLIGGGLVWLFGRSASHVGISGLIYSLAAFLIVAGIYKKDMKSLILSIAVLTAYGGLIWGIFPGRYWISWEGHLFGALAGGIVAYFQFKKQ